MFRLGLDWFNTNNYVTSATNDFVASSYDRVNGFIRLDVDKNWNVRLSVQNLGDSEDITSGSRRAFQLPILEVCGMRRMTPRHASAALLAGVLVNLAPGLAGIAAPSPLAVSPGEVIAQAPEPKQIRFLVPPYPSAQMRNGISGYVLVQFRLDEKGRPRDSRVLMTNPQGAFESAVLRHLWKVRYDVPPEWAARNPTRLLEIGYIFVFERCVDKNLFPGITSVVISVWRNSADAKQCDGEA